VHDIKLQSKLSCTFSFWYGMHSRDTTVLIHLLWFNVVHYSSLFQYFFSIYSSWKFLIFEYTCLSTFFVNTTMIMIEIQCRGGSKGFRGTPSDRSLALLDKLLKMLLKFRWTKICYFITRHSLSLLLCTGNYVILHGSQ